MNRRKSDYLDNPVTQITFHKRMMRFWVVNGPLVVCLYAVSFILPKYSLPIIGFIGTYTALISLYANWDTDFGALSAAQSTLATLKQTEQKTERPLLKDLPLN